jgi:hypothetical protein
MKAVYASTDSYRGTVQEFTESTKLRHPSKEVAMRCAGGMKLHHEFGGGHFCAFLHTAAHGMARNRMALLARHDFRQGCIRRPSASP